MTLLYRYIGPDMTDTDESGNENYIYKHGELIPKECLQPDTDGWFKNTCKGTVNSITAEYFKPVKLGWYAAGAAATIIALVFLIIYLKNR